MCVLFFCYLARIYQIKIKLNRKNLNDIHISELEKKKKFTDEYKILFGS